MTPEIQLMMRMERALENQRQAYARCKDEPIGARRVPQSHNHAENRSIMNLLPNRLLKTALAFIAFAVTAMLVGFVAADATLVPQAISGEMVFYSILAVFDLALMVGLAKLARW